MFRQTLIKSFKCAISGFFEAFKGQRNIRIHITAAILVVILGIMAQISQLEWVALTLCIGAVITSELFNTALEKAVDLVTTDFHPLAKASKDISAAATLIASLTSIVVGLLIFLPKYKILKELILG